MLQPKSTYGLSSSVSSEPLSCKCEPCPIDLSALFPGARIYYEDPAFQGTLCKWHWQVKFEKGRKGMTVSPSGMDEAGNLWLWVDDGNENAHEVPVAHARQLDAAHKARRK